MTRASELCEWTHGTDRIPKIMECHFFIRMMMANAVLINARTKGLLAPGELMCAYILAGIAPQFCA